MTNQDLRSALQVGEWTVEPTLNQLSSAARTVKIEPKAMEVLLYLAARPGEVASREALLAAVWRGVVVGDDALTQVVIKLRKALGEAPDKPSYIQTIPKRGYRLIAPVAGAGTPRRSGGLRAWLAATAVLLLVGGVVFAVLRGGTEAANAPRTLVVSAPPAAPSLPTVGVRTFEAVGDDAEAKLLAQGMTADLVSGLVRLPDFSVLDTAITGTSHPADYRVTGTVQRLGDRIRVNVFLAEGRTGRQLWAERFDRERTGFAAIQEDLERRIIQALPARVTEEELRRISRPHTRSLEAYSLFQRGQVAFGVRQRKENAQARALFEQAIALDSSFARAYVALALTHLWDFRNQWTPNGEASLARGFELARTAREINPDIPEPYFALAFLHTHRREHTEALAQVEQLLRLAPSYADAHALAAAVQQNQGRMAESLQAVRTAQRLNPQGSYLYLVLLGRAYLFLGDLEQARINLEQALARNPAYLDTRVFLVAVHMAAGDRAEARWHADEIRALQPDFAVRRWIATYPLSDPTHVATLERALSAVGL